MLTSYILFQPRDRGGRQLRPPGWVVVLGEPKGCEVDEGGLLLALKKTTFRRSISHTNSVSLSFRFDETTTNVEGIHELSLYLMSDTFLSMDQQLSFCLKVVTSVEGEKWHDDISEEEL